MMKAFGVSLSAGALGNFRKSASRLLAGFMQGLRRAAIASAAGFFGEAGMKARGLGHWAHVAATSLLSFFMLHPKRGQEAHQEMGVLPFFQGALHRDDCHPYRDYAEAAHSLCCAHLLRA